MALTKKGSRLITAGDNDYRWRIRRKLVPCQATFALFTIRRRRGLSVLRFRQAM
jgi:hypothetical protein